MSVEQETQATQSPVTTDQPRIASPQPVAANNTAATSNAAAAQYYHYQPYPGNQPQFPIQGPPGAYNLAAPPGILAAKSNKAWKITKVILNAVVFIFSIIGMSVGLSLLSKKFDSSRYSRYSGYRSGYYYGGYYGDDNEDVIVFIIVGTPIYVVSILWSGAELITRIARKFKGGIHPGAHVGMYLILWLASAAAGGIWAAFLTYGGNYDDDCYNYTNSSEEYQNCLDSTSGDASSRKAIRIADTAFMWIVFIAQFALFIGACIDTNRRNSSRATRLMMMEAQYAAMLQTVGPQQQQQFHQPAMAQTDYKGPVAAPAGVFQPNGQQQPQPQQPEQHNQRQISEYYSPGTAQ